MYMAVNPCRWTTTAWISGITTVAILATIMTVMTIMLNPKILRKMKRLMNDNEG